MKRIALAAVGAASVGLAACSHTTLPTAAPASHRNTPVPVSCRQQYHAWEQDRGERLMASVQTVSSAEATGDRHMLKAALRKARPSVARAVRHPIPACADPMGYWSVLLMHLNAGASPTGAGMRAAMKDVPKIERQLTAELKRTTE